MQYVKVMQILLLGAAVAVQSYPSNPQRSNPYKSEKPIKKDYAFSYDVNDHEAGLEFNQDEKSESGLVMGKYAVQLPDGRKQIVNYQADHDIGFLADVVYEGHASYPSGEIKTPYTVPVSGSSYAPIGDSYAPTKGRYTPPKRYTGQKQTYSPPKQTDQKQTYTPPKRYTDQKQTYNPLKHTDQKQTYTPPKPYTDQKQTYSPPKQTYTPPKRYTDQKQTYSPPKQTDQKQTYIPPKQTYSPPKQTDQKQKYTPPKRYTEQKQTYTPPKRYTDQKQTYTPPKKEPPRKSSHVPKKKGHAPQGVSLPPPKIDYSIEEAPVELPPHISPHQSNLNPNEVGYPEVTPSKGSSQTEPWQEHDPLQDYYQLPLMEIPDMYKDILDPSHQREEILPEPNSKQDHAGSIPTPFIPIPYEEFPVPFYPPHLRFSDGPIPTGTKIISPDVQSEPVPAAAKVARNEVRSMPKPETISVIRPKLKKTRLPPVANEDLQLDVQSRALPEVPTVNKIVQVDVQSKSPPVEETKPIILEAQSKPLEAAKKIINNESKSEPKQAAKYINYEESKPKPQIAAEKTVSNESKSEPLPVAAKIVLPKIKLESIDKPNYVKKPGLFKRKTENS